MFGEGNLGKLRRRLVSALDLPTGQRFSQRVATLGEIQPKSFSMWPRPNERNRSKYTGEGEIFPRPQKCKPSKFDAVQVRFEYGCGAHLENMNSST